MKFIEPLQKEEDNLPDENADVENTGGSSVEEQGQVEGFAPGSTVEFDEPTLF